MINVAGLCDAPSGVAPEGILPTILKHEGAGIVVKVGEDVTPLTGSSCEAPDANMRRPPSSKPTRPRSATRKAGG